MQVANSKKSRTVSSHAAAAKAIKEELKEAFPAVTFRVTSESFSMGNAVNIYWIDGPTVASVDAIADKYQFGHFNGMEDIYEYSNTREDIPQAKYVNTQRTISDEVRATVKAEIAQNYNIDMDDDSAVFAVFHAWPDQVIYREYSQRAF